MFSKRRKADANKKKMRNIKHKKKEEIYID
jgi:hypothetical protein